MHPARRVVLKAVALPLLVGGVLLGIHRLDDHRDIEEVGYKGLEVQALGPETVFLGSSHTYRHIDPALFDSLRGGGTSYNFGLRGATALEFHYQAEELLRLPSIEQLVLELRVIAPAPDLANRDNRRTYYYHDLRRLRLASESAFAYDRPLSRTVQVVLGRTGVAIDNYFLPGQGDELMEGRLYEPKPFSPLDRRGFSVLDHDPEVTKRNEQFLTPRGQAVFARKVEMIRQRASAVPTRPDSVIAGIWLDLYRRAAAQGVEVVFVEHVGEQNVAGAAQLLSEMLPPEHLLVFNDPDRYPELFDVDVWFDRGHLNERGARLFTTMLADRLPLGP